MLLEYALKIDEAIGTDNRIATIVWKERWLNESTSPDLANNFPQEPKSGLEHLVVGNRSGIQVVVICDSSSAAVASL